MRRSSGKKPKISADLIAAIDKAGETAKKIKKLTRLYESDRLKVMEYLASCHIPLGMRVGGKKFAATLKLQPKSIVQPDKVRALVGIDKTLEVAKISKKDALRVLTKDQITTVVVSVPATKPTLLIEKQKEIGG